MVINAFANKIIPLADDSYSQYYQKKKLVKNQIFIG